MTVKQCPQCGESLAERAIECPNCGHKLEAEINEEKIRTQITRLEREINELRTKHATLPDGMVTYTLAVIFSFIAALAFAILILNNLPAYEQISTGFRWGIIGVTTALALGLWGLGIFRSRNTAIERRTLTQEIEKREAELDTLRDKIEYTQVEVEEAA